MNANHCHKGKLTQPPILHMCLIGLLPATKGSLGT